MNARVHGEPRHLGRRILITLLVVMVLLGGLAAAGAVLWSSYGAQVSQALGWTSNDYEGEGHGETIVVVTSGEIGEDVANSLEEAGVVKTSEAFYELLLAQEPAVEFMPGSYRLRLEMSAQAALDALQDPANRMAFTAMIPEGKTVAQTLEIVSAGADIPLEELEAAAADPAAFDLPPGVSSLEGWLFPATYEFEGDTTGAEAVATLVNQQKAVLDEFGVPLEDRERVLNIAAMVQREAGRAEDFGKVARVIQNRLDQGMKLQMDSTAQYGMGQHEDGSVWSTDEALADDNPWNTYVHEGLPKGPIANPGRDAIAAALNPEPGDWLYFVAIDLDTGESVFSKTNEEHEAAVQRLNEWCAANPGKGC
ncbi:endolytic transglycosylase MltG [Leucobacter massiliensis]|uniref:Endolytic murein transglycosylase n=1 Tax=Leucobacter massiliensis TaxID=1686285 RepID=A0A2S9QRM2_9MICO|nr:endolytic transglycosylase MltG [Leucobacter massiliensis]PRI12222.1 ABC transporter substrate-binding protein [Leucobacter massiliensis]